MREPKGQSQQDLLSSIKSEQPSALISLHGGISFDSIIDRIGFGKYHIKLFFILGLLGMADGSEALVISFIVPVFKDYFNPSFDLEAILGTVIYAGYFVGSLLSGYFSDKYGRRRPVIYSNILMVIIGVISAFPPSVVTFVVLRGLFGIIVGFFSPLAYTILAEITPLKYRGKYMILISIFYTFGELISCGIAMLTLNNLTTGNWHALLAWSTLPAFIAWVFSLIFLDESPRHEMMIGNYENGIKVLNKMYNVNKGTTSNPVNVMTPEEEQKLINVYKNKVAKKPMPETVKESDRLLSTVKELFKGNNKRITPFIWLNWFAQTLTYYGITYILPTTLSNLNLSDGTDGNDVSSVIYSCLFELPSVIIAAIIVDVKYFGRRNSLALSFLFGGAVCVLAGFKIWPGFVMWVSFAKFFYNLAFSMNYQLTSEIYPTKARGTGLGLATAFGRIGSIIMPSISTWLGNIAILAPYWVYGGAAIFAGLGTWLIPVDTSNLQMDALDRTFEIDGGA